MKISLEGGNGFIGEEKLHRKTDDLGIHIMIILPIPFFYFLFIFCHDTCFIFFACPKKN